MTYQKVNIYISRTPAPARPATQPADPSDGVSPVSGRGDLSGDIHIARVRGRQAVAACNGATPRHRASDDHSNAPGSNTREFEHTRASADGKPPPLPPPANRGSAAVESVDGCEGGRARARSCPCRGEALRPGRKVGSLALQEAGARQSIMHVPSFTLQPLMPSAFGCPRRLHATGSASRPQGATWGVGALLFRRPGLGRRA